MHQETWVHAHLRALSFVFDRGWRRLSRQWCVHQLFAGRFQDHGAYHQWRVHLYSPRKSSRDGRHSALRLDVVDDGVEYTFEAYAARGHGPAVPRKGGLEVKDSGRRKMNLILMLSRRSIGTSPERSPNNPSVSSNILVI